MMNPKNQRSLERIAVSLPIQLSFGSQITIQGQTKDLSAKSAFVIVKSSVHMDVHDELTFKIVNSVGDKDASISGVACISRVSPGEGIAIYFTKLDGGSTAHLSQLMNSFAKA